MELFHFRPSFDELLGVKSEPNSHELLLFKRTKRYIEKITWIPGIRMIAVVNSLSMYATHKDSDIDLFIVTEKNRMWFVRVLLTFIFWMHGVWRHKKEIAGNFCLSFLVEDEMMDIEKIALKNDVYLYFWMYYMKPILLDDTIWAEFQKKNKEYRFSEQAFDHLKYRKGTMRPPFFLRWTYSMLNSIFRSLGEKKAQKNWLKKGKPEGVMITKGMLKFHDKDKRKEIREKLMDK